MKSLFQLLREEDKAIRDYESYQEDYKHFSKMDAPEYMALEYKKRAVLSKNEIDSVREEIGKYLKIYGITGKEIVKDEKNES